MEARAPVIYDPENLIEPEESISAPQADNLLDDRQIVQRLWPVVAALLLAALGLIVQLGVVQLACLFYPGLPNQMGAPFSVNLQGHGLVEGGCAEPQSSTPVGRRFIASLGGGVASAEDE